MEWQDIVSIIAMYILLQIFVCGAYIFAAVTDSALYETNKYNENRKTKRIGMKRLFWRCKKDDPKEIFTVALIHEVISIFLFLVVTVMFILALTLNKEIILFIGSAPIFAYFLYCLIMQNYIVRKNKNQYK